MTLSENNDAAYEQLQQQLASANASIEAAEVHGVICGVLATGRDLPESWFAELFDQSEAGDLLVTECRNSVDTLLAMTAKGLDEGGAGMRPLLPADDVALPIRARAIVDWCQGFLYGLGMAGETLQQLPEEAQESIEDISAISQLDLNDLGQSDAVEEEEQALMEINEFLWVAAMLIREHSTGQSTAEQETHEYH